ncbi:conserved hypothetical protein [Histoplasma mississippiense (nom. inval.)]|uniref:conserved hypothetical protein n=1 Tax=Ajellomyces capsulatus (strain NAm1 / WU24) TaxID=2059318 RepID=UPI000157CD05|nr:conserved hypothetical protein [Histoplasma mississippiense (nom. inval.)]EDN09935.1 conserved hypothetical protein [Histoplasma mississippiense (nom. inval.)]
MIELWARGGVGSKWIAYFKLSDITAVADGWDELTSTKMASTPEILSYLLKTPPKSSHSIAYNYLVPNIKGLQNLVNIMDNDSPPASESSDSNTLPKPTTEISLFAAATEAFSKANTNCTIEESLERIRPIVALAKEKNIRVRGYVSVALGCPYEGPDVSPHKVAEITATLLEMGADEVSVADTTGMGTAPRTLKLLQTLTSAGIAIRISRSFPRHVWPSARKAPMWVWNMIVYASTSKRGRKKKLDDDGRSQCHDNHVEQDGRHADIDKFDRQCVDESIDERLWQEGICTESKHKYPDKPQDTQFFPAQLQFQPISLHLQGQKSSTIKKFSCGDWAWGSFAARCNHEYRMGETCGMKLVHSTENIQTQCKLCEKIDTKCRRRNTEIERLARWQREGGTLKASMEKSSAEIRALEEEIRQLEYERLMKQKNIGK